MPPANDDFAAAIDLAADSGHLTFSNVGATTEAGEPANAEGHSVWFKWTPTIDGPAYVRTGLTPLPDWDSYLAVYTGTSFADLVLVVSDDDDDLQLGSTDAFGTSKVSWDVVSGTTYYIQVTAWDDVSGPVERADARLDWLATVYPPLLTGVTPTEGKAGTAVTISGDHLDLVTDLKFGSIDVPFVYDPIADVITANVPPLGVAIAAPIIASDAGGSGSIAFQPWYPGPWTQPPAGWYGDARGPAGSWWTSRRYLQRSDPADFSNGTDDGGSSFGGDQLITGVAQALVEDVGPPTGWEYDQPAAVVDVSAIWANTPSTYDLHFAMDPQPIVAIDPAISSPPAHAIVDSFGVARYDWEGADSLADCGTFQGKYRFHVTRSRPGSSVPETSPLHIQLRRLLESEYSYSPPINPTTAPALLDHWFFPSALLDETELIEFAIAGAVSVPDEVGYYELNASTLDHTETTHAFVVTHTEYLDNTTFTSGDVTNVGVYQVYVAFFYLPQRYKIYYDEPQTAGWTVGSVTIG